jgi:predicted SprT family Zn-dependent metalloprotease
MAKSHTSKEHGQKMCALTCCPHDLPIAKIKALVKGAKYVCTACGRAAANARNLCAPEAID